MRILIVASIFLAATSTALATESWPREERLSDLPPHVSALARAGWHLRDLELEDAPDGSGEVRLSLVLVRDAHGEKLTLIFGNYGASLVGYWREEVPAPAERRVYRDEADLLEALSRSDQMQLFEECGGWYLEVNGEATAIVNPYAYHVVERATRGKDAGRDLARALADALDGGATLVDVRRTDQAIDFILAAGAQTTLHAELDRRGRIVALEVRREPIASAYQKVRTARTLGRTLREGREIKALAFDDVSDRPRLVGTLRGGRRFVIDLADVEYADDEGGCGC